MRDMIVAIVFRKVTWREKEKREVGEKETQWTEKLETSRKHTVTVYSDPTINYDPNLKLVSTFDCCCSLRKKQYRASVYVHVAYMDTQMPTQKERDKDLARTSSDKSQF